MSENSNTVPQTLSEHEYLNLAETLLKSVEVACDRINEMSDVDIDALRSGNMVTLVFANRNQIVINTQKPLLEIWLAAPSGGFHYRYQGNAWRDTKGESEFFSDLSRLASLEGGQLIQFEQI